METKFISIVSAFIMFCSNGYSQGHIEHIKNQPYLKLKDKVDCNNLEGDNLSARICANLAFQKSDSILVTIHNALLTKAKEAHNDSLKTKVNDMQASWRIFRDKHCEIIYDSFEGCGSCHLQAIFYLNCLKELTDDRIKELKTLLIRLEGL